MIAFVSAILGSKIGRWIAGVALAVAGAFAAYRLVKASGAQDERAKRQAQDAIDAINTLNTKVKTDEDLRRVPPDERRRRLRERADAAQGNS